MESKPNGSRSRCMFRLKFAGDRSSSGCDAKAAGDSVFCAKHRDEQRAKLRAGKIDPKHTDVLQ